MAFSRGPMRAPTPTRTRGAVFAIGRLVHVTSPAGRSMSVSLTDDTGDKCLASLGDGTEVAIVAWRPNGATGTRYCVRTTDSAVEGWIPVGNLRSKDPIVVPSNPKPPVVTASPAVPLRVGARRASRPSGARRSAL